MKEILNENVEKHLKEYKREIPVFLKKIDVIAIGEAYNEFVKSTNEYGDIKSFIGFDAGFRAALKYMEEKLRQADTANKEINTTNKGG